MFWLCADFALDLWGSIWAVWQRLCLGRRRLGLSGGPQTVCGCWASFWAVLFASSVQRLASGQKQGPARRLDFAAQINTSGRIISARPPQTGSGQQPTGTTVSSLPRGCQAGKLASELQERRSCLAAQSLLAVLARGYYYYCSGCKCYHY